MGIEKVALRLSQAARFWAALSVTTYAATGVLLLSYVLNTQEDGVPFGNVTAPAIIFAAGSASAFGLYKAKREQTSMPIVYACAAAALAVLLHWILTPISLGRVWEGDLWVPYTLWTAPVVLASAIGGIAAAFERTRRTNPPEPAKPPYPLPLVSTALAILIYNEVWIYAFGMTAGYSTDYMPEPVVAAAVALSVPLPLLMIGFSSALTRLTDRAVPLVSAYAVIIVVLLLTLTTTLNALGLLIFAAAVVPLVWPTYRSARIVRAEDAEKAASAQPPEDLAR